MLETLVLAAALAAPTCVTTVPGASLDTAGDRPAGAVGLVVPDAGPRTSERRAVESLLRGEVVNSLRDRLPSSPRLLERCPDSRWNVGVPRGGDQLNDRRYLLTRFDGRRKMSWDIDRHLRQSFGDEVCETRIAENVSIAESPASNRDVFEHAPQSRGAQDYAALLDELTESGFMQ